MRSRIQDGLLYVNGVIAFRGIEYSLEQLLIDTGSAGTMFAADKMLSLAL